MSLTVVSLVFPLNPFGGGFVLCVWDSLAVVSLDFPSNPVGGVFALCVRDSFCGGFVEFSFKSRWCRFLSYRKCVFLICFLKGEGVP